MEGREGRKTSPWRVFEARAQGKGGGEERKTSPQRVCETNTRNLVQETGKAGKEGRKEGRRARTVFETSTSPWRSLGSKSTRKRVPPRDREGGQEREEDKPVERVFETRTRNGVQETGGSQGRQEESP